MNTDNLPQTKHFLLIGILLMVLGIVALMTPLMASVVVTWVVGAVLLVSGVVQFVQGLFAKPWKSKFLPLVLGLVTAICGGVVLAHPLFGLTVLTLIVAAFFIVEGVWKIAASFTYRHASGWFWVLFSGVITLLLGMMIWYLWPIDSLYVIGILIGIDLLFTGASLIALGTTVRQMKKMDHLTASPA